MAAPLINHGATREHKFISAPAALCSKRKTHDGSDVKPRVFEAEGEWTGEKSSSLF